MKKLTTEERYIALLERELDEARSGNRAQAHSRVFAPFWQRIVLLVVTAFITAAMSWVGVDGQLQAAVLGQKVAKTEVERNQAIGYAAEQKNAAEEWRDETGAVITQALQEGCTFDSGGGSNE